MICRYDQCRGCGGDTEIKRQFIPREQLAEAKAIYPDAVIEKIDMPINVRWRCCTNTECEAPPRLLPMEIQAGAKVE